MRGHELEPKPDQEEILLDSYEHEPTDEEFREEEQMLQESPNDSRVLVGLHLRDIRSSPEETRLLTKKEEIVIFKEFERDRDQYGLEEARKRKPFQAALTHNLRLTISIARRPRYVDSTLPLP